MQPAKKFQDLIVWQKAHALVLLIYSLTKKFPKSELFGITSQLQRSAVSIPANIAKGFKKRTNPDKARYLNIAQASLEETRYYLILVDDLEFCQTENALGKLEEVSKLLESYYQKVRTK
ncbi:MAG: four helix bundle protein [Planctomycetota bacterium]